MVWRSFQVPTMDCIPFSPVESICRGYGRGEYPAHIARPNRCVRHQCLSHRAQRQPQTLCLDQICRSHYGQTRPLPCTIRLTQCTSWRGVARTAALGRLSECVPCLYSSVIVINRPAGLTQARLWAPMPCAVPSRRRRPNVASACVPAKRWLLQEKGRVLSVVVVGSTRSQVAALIVSDELPRFL